MLWYIPKKLKQFEHFFRPPGLLHAALCNKCFYGCSHMVSYSRLLCITVIWFQFISIQSDNKELCTEKKYFVKILTNFLQKTEQNKRLLCADKVVRRSKERVSKANTEGDPLTKFYVSSYEGTSEEYLFENFLHVILRISAETRRKLMSVCRTFYGQLVVQNIHITTRNICHPPTTNEDLAHKHCIPLLYLVG